MVSPFMKLSGHIILMTFNDTDFLILTKWVFSQSHIILICSPSEKHESWDWLDLAQRRSCAGGCLIPPGGDASGCLRLRVAWRQRVHQDQHLSEDLFLNVLCSSGNNLFNRKQRGHHGLANAVCLAQGPVAKACLLLLPRLKSLVVLGMP